MCARCQLLPIVNCEHCIQLQIEQIINRNRYQEEKFLVDTKTAATEIFKLLKATDINSNDFKATSEPVYIEA